MSKLALTLVAVAGLSLFGMNGTAEASHRNPGYGFYGSPYRAPVGSFHHGRNQFNNRGFHHGHPGYMYGRPVPRGGFYAPAPVIVPAPVYGPIYGPSFGIQTRDFGLFIR